MIIHLHQRHRQRVEQTLHLLTAPYLRSVVITVVGLAGLLHLLLIRVYFDEQLVYGLVFTALALFQLLLAFLLAMWPGPRTYRMGVWSSGLIVLIYVLARLIPLSTSSSVSEEVGILRSVATYLELVAIPLLAVALPEPITMRRPRGTPVWWGIGGAGVFAFLWSLLIGVVQWTNVVYPPTLTWVGTSSWSALTPILVGAPLPHVWLTASWWILPTIFMLTVLVGLNLGYSTRLLLNGFGSARGRRARLLALVSAGLVTPMCCSTSLPLLVLLGVPPSFGVMAAPFAALLSVILLALSLILLRIQFKRAACCADCKARYENSVSISEIDSARRLS